MSLKFNKNLKFFFLNPIFKQIFLPNSFSLKSKNANISTLKHCTNMWRQATVETCWKVYQRWTFNHVYSVNTQVNKQNLLDQYFNW